MGLVRSTGPTSMSPQSEQGPGLPTLTAPVGGSSGTAVHHVEHGDGRPVVVLHGAGVDHHEAEACFEPALGAYGGLRRLYPDLPGMGRTPAPPTLQSADGVLEVLLRFLDDTVGDQPVLLVGHSAGAYYAQGLALRHPQRVAGLALVCPLLAETRDVPAHRPVIAAPELGDAAFRDYFVVQTPAMLRRHERHVAPAARLDDAAAMERIEESWRLTGLGDGTLDQPLLVVAGRQDSTVGYVAAAELAERCPRATLAVVDGAGHALPHERLGLLGALLGDWLDRAVAADPGR